MAPSKLRKTASLFGVLMKYVVPRGNTKIRLRIGVAFACLVAAKGSNMVTPLLYGAAVDLVNGGSGFAMSALMFVVGGYALARQSSGFSGDVDNDTLINNRVERAHLGEVN